MAARSAASRESLSTGLLKVLAAIAALGIAGYIVGPPLYWHLSEALRRSSAAASASGCLPCSCDCSALPLLAIPEALSNVSFEDCARRDPEVSEEMERSFTDLLSEELKLREAENSEAQRHAEVMLLEAKKMASQFQKEADKCSSGMDTCEEARERVETALSEQWRLTATWELRARQRGWKNP